MKHWMVFRAVAPPGFSLKQYEAHSNEPIRYDCVTVVEAETAQEAVNAVIAATGLVAIGMAAVECTMIGFTGQALFGEGGALKATPETDKVLGTGSDDSEPA